MNLSNITLETKRLIIREFKLTDLLDMNAYSRLAKTARYMPWKPNTLAESKAAVKYFIRTQKQKPRLTFEVALESKTEHKIIGACGLRIKSVPNREGDIGYVLHPDYWDQGYTTEAVKALLQFGFKKLKLHRIWATCDPKNKASEMVMRKCGLKKEGVLRSHVLQKGKWRSSYLYAKLESDK